MNYELVKQLKDAGWEKYSGVPLFIDDNVFPPSLSELIEAIGIKFDRLSFVGDEWLASVYTKGINLGDDIVIARGNAPEEAVAKLWLELNKK